MTSPRTFHPGRDDLHGYTVVVETVDAVYVGRCDDVRAGRVLLLDADRHAGDGPARAAFLREAAARGPWPRHRRVAIPLAGVTALRRLGEPPATGVDTAAPA